MLCSVAVTAMSGSFWETMNGRMRGDLFGLAAVGEGEDHVVGVDAAEVAVDGFGRVQEVSAGAGRGERGDELLADQAGLAHAGDDDGAAGRRGCVRRRQQKPASSRWETSRMALASSRRMSRASRS